jgi:two-component system, sensor histidine kinase RegB
VTEPAAIAYSASTLNLRRLAVIRAIVIVGLVFAVAYAYLGLGASLNYPALILVLLLMAGLNGYTLWRSRRPGPVSSWQYFVHLLADVIGLSVLLYFSGGATNPFVSYYLVPLCISAALLPGRLTWILAALSLLAYTGLMFQYLPLPELLPSHSEHQSSFNLHILGMWINFLVSACLITFFVVKMAQTLRDQQQELIEQRERALRSDHIVSIATMAAGTAHELGTPLSTMAIVLDDMANENSGSGQDIVLLKQQLDICKQSLSQLVNTAEVHQHGERKKLPLDVYIEQRLQQWQLMRPRVNYKVKLLTEPPAPQVAVDPTLNQAIANLLNNAADAHRHSIDITCSWTGANWTLDIVDDGCGVSAQISTRPGQLHNSTKKSGLGLGLFLSHATIDRYGGELTLKALDTGGTLARIILPLED